MLPRALLCLATLSALVAPAATAHGGWSHCGGTEISISDSAFLVLDPNGWMWLYVETNGVQHLQRGDTGDTCQEAQAARMPHDTGFLVM